MCEITQDFVIKNVAKQYLRLVDLKFDVRIRRDECFVDCFITKSEKVNFSQNQTK